MVGCVKLVQVPFAMCSDTLPKTKKGERNEKKLRVHDDSREHTQRGQKDKLD